MTRRLSNVIGFDDAPFARDHRGDVPLVGVVWADRRMDGMLTTRVRRDGRNATAALARAVIRSRFAEHVQAVMLHGIAVAGFNVVDLEALHVALGLPVLVVARKRPDLSAIERALRDRVPGGARKWALIAKAPPMEPLGPLWCQRAGLTQAEAAALVAKTTVHGHLPEPLRLAHLIGAALVSGESHGGA